MKTSKNTSAKTKEETDKKFGEFVRLVLQERAEKEEKEKQERIEKAKMSLRFLQNNAITFEPKNTKEGRVLYGSSI